MALKAAPTGGDITLGQYVINLMDEMGRGTFGTVYKGTHKKSNAVVAVKKIQIKDDRAGGEGLEEIKKFEKIAAHKNVVALHDFHYLDTSFWMIMEFCDEGDIDHYMKKTDVDLQLRLKFMGESADALCHMHNQVVPIVHRDIKPGNILVKNVGGSPVIKLTDFGLSKMVDAEDMMKTAMFNTVVGTPGFMAPELYLKEPYNQAVDVFAMGLVFLAVLNQKGKEGLCPVSTGATGMMMSIGQEMMMMHKMNQPMPDLVKDDPSESASVKAVKEAIKKMTVFEPKKRINMQQVMNVLRGADGIIAASLSPRRSAPTTPTSPTPAFEPLRFHSKYGPQSEVINSGKVPIARRQNPTVDYQNATVFTNRPLAPNERFDIRLENITPQWSGGLAFGVCLSDPTTIKLPASGTNLPNSWIMTDTSFCRNGECIIDNYGLDLEDLKDGDRVGLIKTADGRLNIFINGLDQGVAARNVPDGVYGVVDLYGKASGVCISSGGGAAAEAGKSAKAEGKLFSRRRMPTPPPEFVSSTTSSASFDDEDDDGLGMVLLKQALEEKVEKMVGSTGGKEEKKRIEDASTMELFKRAFDKDKFAVAEKVKIDDDIEKAKRLQKGHGGWNDRMKHYLGQEGVIDAKRFMQIDVKFDDGRKWSWNPDLVHKMDEMPNVKPPFPNRRRDAAMHVFKANDIVKIMADKDRFEQLQKDAGLWQDWLGRVAGTTGIVHRVDADGDVVVEIITGEKIYVHGNVLTHLSQDGLEVESGDLVFVINDVEQVKRNQQGFGGWHEDMKDLVGHATTVKKVMGQKAILEDSGKRWALNVRSLMVVAKNRDLMRAVFAKQESTRRDTDDVEIPCRVQ